MNFGRDRKQGLPMFTGTKSSCCCIICVTGLCPQRRPLGWSRLEAVRQLRRMGSDSQHENNRQINRAVGDTARATRAKIGFKIRGTVSTEPQEPCNPHRTKLFTLSVTKPSRYWYLIVTPFIRKFKSLWTLK